MTTLALTRRTADGKQSLMIEREKKRDKNLYRFEKTKELQIMQETLRLNIETADSLLIQTELLHEFQEIKKILEGREALSEEELEYCREQARLRKQKRKHTALLIGVGATHAGTLTFKPEDRDDKVNVRELALKWTRSLRDKLNREVKKGTITQSQRDAFKMHCVVDSSDKKDSGFHFHFAMSDWPLGIAPRLDDNGKPVTDRKGRTTYEIKEFNKDYMGYVYLTEIEDASAYFRYITDKYVVSRFEKGYRTGISINPTPERWQAQPCIEELIKHVMTIEDDHRHDKRNGDNPKWTFINGNSHFISKLLDLTEAQKEAIRFTAKTKLSAADYYSSFSFEMITDEYSELMIQENFEADGISCLSDYCNWWIERRYNENDVFLSSLNIA